MKKEERASASMGIGPAVKSVLPMVGATLLSLGAVNYELIKPATGNTLIVLAAAAGFVQLIRELREKSAQAGKHNDVSVSGWQVAKHIEEVDSEDVDTLLSTGAYLRHASRVIATQGKTGDDEEQAKILEEKAIELYEKAAGKGSSSAHFYLADIYQGPETFFEDIAKSARHYQEASEKGNLHARNNLALFYLHGVHLEKDVALGISMLEECAEQGLPHSKQKLGQVYIFGHDVEKNIAKGIAYTQDAAAEGMTEAIANLGAIYLRGELTERDVARGMSLTKIAALAGETTAQQNYDQVAKHVDNATHVRTLLMQRIWHLGMKRYVTK